MHPLGWMFKYFIGSIVGAATVVQAVKIAKLELGNTVEGIIFRDRVHPDKYERDDEEF
jgi:hypothetical protein|tara:strand:+ start:889 stop:1062 length:174 start_codon:yes stop_codon:yes gene_type:complete